MKKDNYEDVKTEEQKVAERNWTLNKDVEMNNCKIGNNEESGWLEKGHKYRQKKILPSV